MVTKTYIQPVLHLWLNILKYSKWNLSFFKQKIELNIRKYLSNVNDAGVLNIYYEA